MEAFLDGWQSGAAAVNSVFRKCEYDWRTVSIILLDQNKKSLPCRTLERPTCSCMYYKAIYLMECPVQ